MESWSGEDRIEYVVRDSHRSLLPAVENAAARLGASAPEDVRGLVMVPVSRSSPVLTCAVGAAQRLGWPLLLVCSHEAKAPGMRELVWDLGADVDLVAADLLHADFLRAGRDWTTSAHPAARQRAEIDTNRKRNLALAAARMTGRPFVLFVDDDVVGLTPEYVTQALAVLQASPAHRVVSWPLAQFPDNSVVHHARRDVLGRPQETFIGGGALLIGTDAWQPSGFPPMYNEDWLFLFDPIADGAVMLGPDVGQADFDPYAEPGRAAREEFGDILGEGLFHLLHARLPVDVARHGHYWQSVHRKRGKLLARLVEEARAQAADPRATDDQRARSRRVIHAITESRAQHLRCTPESLADFVRRWRHDEETWRVFCRRLPERPTVKDALVHLGLHESWVVTADA